ncbi:uncharacterized protein LOC142336283 [Convolutriloba macropyga]|uniref:uncharacterized protein LOC142336283 n=1 Tax=Convolutriloba macropyga TaxID=536237 RepID=UPI003F52480C
MGDTNESLPSDDSGVPDTSEELCLAPNQNSVPVDELSNALPVCSEPRCWLDEIQVLVEEISNIEQDAIEWIMSHVFHWESLDDLAKCEDLSPKNVKALKIALASIFKDLQEKRELFLIKFDSSCVAREKLLASHLVKYFDKGYEELVEACSTPEIKSQLSSAEIDNIKRVLQQVDSPTEVNQNKELTILMHEVESFLKDSKLSDDAVHEVRNGIQTFESLECGLKSCEELTTKQVKLLADKLKEPFDKLKKLQQQQHVGERALPNFGSLSLPNDGIAWLEHWLANSSSSALDLREIDLCEDLTKRQVVHVKAIVRDFYKIDGNGNSNQVTETVNSREKFLKEVETILVGKDDAIEITARRWIMDNITEIKTLEELYECEDLTKKQVSFLKLKLEFLFDSYRSQVSNFSSSHIENSEQICTDQTASDLKRLYLSKIEETTGGSTKVEDSVEESQYILTQLIMFSTEMQEGFSVEKFTLSENGIKYLCNSVPGNLSTEFPVLYYSSTNGVMIDFEALNQVSIECIGLFGPLKGVIECLKRVLFSHLPGLEDLMLSEKPGLYLLDFASEGRKFVLFNSKNDADFNVVRKDSRAVHFLRYMSQLCNNVVMCLDGNYEDRLAVDQDKLVVKCDRRSRYNLKKHETQQESITLTCLGLVHEPELARLSLFSSQNGLIALTFEKTQENLVTKNQVHYGPVGDFKGMIDKMKISDLGDICATFKIEYIKVFAPNEFASIQEEVFRKATENLEVEEIKTHEIVLVSAALYFIQTEISEIFAIIEQYFLNNRERTEKLWDDVIQFDYDSIATLIDKHCLKTIRLEFRNRTKENILDKYLMWHTLKRCGKKLTGTLRETEFGKMSWEELQTEAQKQFGSYRSALCNACKPSTCIKNEIKKAVTEIDYEDVDEDFQTSIDLFIWSVCDMIEPYSKKPLFRAFLQNMCSEDSHKRKDKMLSDEASAAFDKLMTQIERSRCCDDLTIESEETIIDIKRKQKPISGCPNYFFCDFKKVIKEPAKTYVKFFQLTAKKEEYQRMSCGGDILNVGELEFLRVGQLNATALETVHAVYPIDNSKTMILFNENNASKFEVYNLSNMKKRLNGHFGKRIYASFFDCKTDVLALHMHDDTNPWTIQLIKFDSEYKCRSNLNPVDLNKMFGVEKQFLFCLQPNSKFLWFYYEERLRKVDCRTRSMVKSVKLVHSISKLLSTPDGSCVLAVTDNGTYLPVMTETGNVVEKIDNAEMETHMLLMCNQMLSVKRKGSALSVDKITVTGAEHETKLTKTSGWQKSNEINGTETKLEAHWINYIYWMYTKFPCVDILSSNKNKIHFWFTSSDDSSKLCQQLQDEILSMRAKLQFTRKPLDNMQVHPGIFLCVSSNNEFQTEAVKMGDFVKKLITFIPIQVARCQSNAFHILCNGHPLPLDTVNVAFDLVEKIDLGFYDSIFSSWHGDIKVISSMGKQSTGKSYTLNHLTGSSFNIAATRCTDGCWMTVKEQDDCLYVILDFEGLGSIERTEQDDMLLSLFNSSISTITIFKSEKRIDREIDRMFSKINMGSDQLKGTEKVFKGKFMIVINDVAEQDVDDTPKEFEEKISTIVCKSESNFIKKLYNSDFEIIAFPSLESSDYYETMKNLLAIVNHEVKPLFKGVEFVRTLKLLMAKLAINDFSPLDRQQIDERIRILRSSLKNAIHYGRTSDGDSKHKEYELKGLDNPNFKPIIETDVKLEGVGTVKLNDLEIVFKEEQLGGILMKFLSITTPNPENCLSWRIALEHFVLECINLRFKRVRSWLEENLRKWKESEKAEYDDIICGVLENLDNWKLNFIQTYRFCEEKCAKCFLKCTQIVNHRSGHQCATSHHCTADCAYCDQKDTKQCKMAFGHDGKHVCAEINHVCGAPCRFSSLNGCVGECHKMTRHDGEHECSERRHPCAGVCSLVECEGRCIVDCEIEHSIHKCIKEQCIKECSIATCTNRCAALDHFHGTELSAVFEDENGVSHEPPFLLDDGSRVECEEHFCGKEHQCDFDCKHEGFCRVWTEKQLKEETFDGQRDTFTYSLAFAEKGEKLKCRRKLESFTRVHDGDHSCSTEVHICTAKCPTCENICDKPINHQNEGDILHHARHGNMRKCFFIANEDDIQVGSHKYKVGEPAVAEMCHIFCNSLGRGHPHIVECDSLDPTLCAYIAKEDGRRHETTKYHPNPDIPKDEITHDAYWTLIGFQDPCQEVDIEQFQKCSAFCSAEDHEKDDETMFCQMPLWHEPVKSINEANLVDGFVTKDGHVFPCNHPVGIYHFVLCLDDSWSMGGQPWEDLVNGVLTFIAQRLNQSSSDMLSIEIYNQSGRIVAEYIPITCFQKSVLTYNGGGTDFSVALNLADEVIGRHIEKHVIPVLIFMSDGGSYNGEIEMENIAKKYRVAHGLQVYTLGFGKVYFEKLRELARLGHGEHIDAVNGVELKTAFVDISAKHPPKIGVAF